MLRRLGVRGKILVTLAMPILVLAVAAGWVSWDSLQQARIASEAADRVESLAVQDSAGEAFAESPTLNVAAALGINQALGVAREINHDVKDLELSRYLNAYIDVNRTMLDFGYERPVVGEYLAALANGEVAPSLPLRAVARIDASTRQYNDTKNTLTPLANDYEMPAIDGAFGLVRTAVAKGDVSTLGTTDAVAQWSANSQEWLAKAQPVRDAVRDDTVAFARGSADDARTTAIITALVAFGILGLSVIIALAVARRIVRPLRRLTEATAEIRDRLPQMVEQMAVPGHAPTIDLFEIPVESQDEIGRLAQSFNDVNATTVVVAQEQAALRGSIAEMFVNVARRDQVLLNRQLAFLDELERTEEDPSALASLFRLDHLATRMRRNAESLLVLAGIDAGRKVRAPMPLSDVIRTASSEIELYDRVHLDLPIDPLMLGHHALGAAHLLAELLENATMFSEPHTPVEVATATAEGYVVVTIRDHGLGMTAAEVAEANRRVASRTAQDAVGAQRLGLYVVGRIAERLGAAISFSVGANTAGYTGAGTLVTVAFPAGLFLPDDAVSLPEPTDPLEIAAPMPAAPPLPSAPAASAQSFAQTAFPEEPAPTYTAVDLNALTDGTTTAGMPRRRTAQPEPVYAEPLPASPAYPAQPDAYPVQSEHPEFDQMVLPPLEAPVLAAELTTDTTAWSPATAAPANTVAVNSALPSRPRSAEPEPVPFEPEPISVPTMAVQERSSFFASFRSLGELEDTVGGAIHLDAVIEDPAAVPAPVELAVPAPPAEYAALAPVAPEPAADYDRREPVLANATVGGEVLENSVHGSSSGHSSSGHSSAGHSGSGHGRSVLPLRSSVDALADPQDPYAIPDTLEARSEWMASAVLYEEMSALLRRGVFAEQAATMSANSSSSEAAYRPVLAGADTPGLLRRGSSTRGGSGDSGPTVNPATDRFTARIERDPEQVRSRFSAFQSATALARSLDEADWPST